MESVSTLDVLLSSGLLATILGLIAKWFSDRKKHPLDREHYVVKQVKPVAEPVLDTLGLDVERPAPFGIIVRRGGQYGETHRQCS